MQSKLCYRWHDNMLLLRLEYTLRAEVVQAYPCEPEPSRGGILQPVFVEVTSSSVICL